MSAERDEVDSEEDGEDPLRLARLAIFCSVFGAAILLGLVLSIAKQQPPTRLSEQRFIRIDLTLTNDKPGQLPLINFHVHTPSGVEDDLPLDMLTATRVRGLEYSENRLASLQVDGIFHTAGLSYFGEERSSNSRGSGCVSLMIENPKRGLWKFSLRYIDANNGDPSIPPSPPAFTCSGSVVASGQRLTLFTTRPTGSSLVWLRPVDLR